MPDPSKLSVEEVRELLAMLERPEDALDIGAYYARVFAFLCNHFLASQQPLTAGEFAGLVMSHFEVQEEEFRQKARASKSKNYVDFNLELIDKCTWARRQISSVAREHNITIVEPKK